MDSRIRKLERLAAIGDDEASRLLKELKRKSCDYPPCPEYLYEAGRRISKETKLVHNYFINKFISFPRTKTNRNVQRLRNHKLAKCGPKCRFCRKHGSYNKNSL